MERRLDGRLLAARWIAALLLLFAPLASADGEASSAPDPVTVESGSSSGDPASQDPASPDPASPDPASPASPDDLFELTSEEEDLGDFPVLEDPILDEPPLELYLFEDEDLVEAASRKTSTLSEAPGTITLIGREQMDSLGVLTLGDLLRYINSSVLLPGTVDTAVEFRGVQQPFNNKILLLQDGRVLNNTYRGDFSLDLAQQLDEVQRVEVVQGPGSALYGANAFAGFINLVTVKGEDIQGVRTRSAFGGDGLWYQSVLTGGKAGNIDWIASARLAGVDAFDPVNPNDHNNEQDDVNLRGRVSGDTWFVDLGFTQLSAGSPGTFRFPTSQDTYDVRQLSLDGRKVWELGDKFKLAVRAFYTDADNTYKFVSLALPDCEGNSPFCNVSLDVIGDIFNIVYPDDSTVPGSVRDAYQIKLNNQGHLREKAGAGDPDVYIDRATYDAWKNGELGHQVALQDSRERRAFTEFQFDWKISPANYLLMGAGVQADILENSDVGNHTFKDFFGFLEDEQRFFSDQLILLGSVRFDSHSYFGDTHSPRLSLIYVPQFGDGAERLVKRERKPFWLKAGYGKAFRSPNFVELFGVTRVGPETTVFGTEQPSVAMLRGNSELDQESIETFELQLHFEPGRTFETTLTAFDYSIDDEVILNVDRDVVFAYQEVTRIPIPDTYELVFDPSLADIPTGAEFINIEEGTQGRGFEFSASWKPRRRLEGLTIWGNYSRMHLDRPIDRELVFVQNEESGVITGSFFQVNRESGLLDNANLGVAWRSKHDRWDVHYRTRIAGDLGDSIFSRGARFAHDISLGFRHGRFEARATGLNLTGEDMLRDPTREQRPDLQASWHVIFGYRWEF